jgi:hypothetical protein
MSLAQNPISIDYSDITMFPTSEMNHYIQSVFFQCFSEHHSSVSLVSFSDHFQLVLIAKNNRAVSGYLIFSKPNVTDYKMNHIKRSL